MDMLSFVVGYKKGKQAGSSSGDGDLSEVYSALDEINGEVIGETLYTVTFIGADGAELGQMSVYENHDCENPVSAGVFGKPTKESTKYIGYTFAGWSLTDGGTASSSALKNITGDRTLYAVFTEYEIVLASGNCGGHFDTPTSIKWAINPDYVLTFTLNASAALYAQSYTITSNSQPWSAYLDEITSVIIGEGIRGVGVRNFDGCSALTAVSFPSTMRTLAGYAFVDCTSLASIEFPAALKYINKNCFSGCTALESATFERTAGWGVYEGSTTSSGVVAALTEAEVGDPATAAAYLVDADNSHAGNWINADAA